MISKIEMISLVQMIFEIGIFSAFAVDRIHSSALKLL